jgi:membrane protein YdbS with pleckstrin-like domain
MTQLMYQCPHCQKPNEVALGTVGEVVECSECKRPFQPEIPLAKMLRQTAEGKWTVAGESIAGQRSSAEKSILTVRPAMFRVNPLSYSAMVIVFILGVAGTIIFGGPIHGLGLERWFRPITLIISVVCAVFAAASLISIFYWFLKTRFESLKITDERTIWERGILDRETSEVQHDDVRNIQMKRSFVDRIFGVGRIAISSAGQDDMEIDIRGVPHPNRVADTIRSCQARLLNRDD